MSLQYRGPVSRHISKSSRAESINEEGILERTTLQFSKDVLIN